MSGEKEINRHEKFFRQLRRSGAFLILFCLLPSQYLRIFRYMQLLLDPLLLEHLSVDEHLQRLVLLAVSCLDESAAAQCVVLASKSLWLLPARRGILHGHFRPSPPIVRFETRERAGAIGECS